MDIDLNVDDLVTAIDGFRQEGIKLDVEMSYALIFQLALGLFVAIAGAMIVASYVTK